MEEKMDPQPPERLEDDVSILTANEQATAAQLRLRDPQLAGLYEGGIRLMGQIHQPGNVYLLAHCGRELSNGVLQLLLDEEGIPTSVQEDEHRRRIADTFQALQSVLDEEGLATPVQGGTHRPRMAHALGLPEDHARVNAWYEAHRDFTDNVHWQRPGPSADVVHSAFARFSSLLYGLIAPYFDTESELNSLLEVELPTVEHAKQLHDLQRRPGQRNYFFGRLTNPAWVEPLADEGFFNNPPGLQVGPDGFWRTRPWPEGQYLMEAAGSAPDAVAAVLEAIPSSNDNPVVWDIVAKAARRLPADLAVRIVPRLTNALKTVPARFFNESVVDLAVVLAEALSANVRETRSTQRIRVGRRQRKRTCWDCEREWKRMVVPLEPGRPSEARQLLRTRR